MSVDEIDPAARVLPGLVRDAEIEAANEALRVVYSALSDELGSRDDAELAYRVRSYDNDQRLTFGRAQSDLLPPRKILEDFQFSDLRRLSQDGPDMSYFPGGCADQRYDHLDDVVQGSVERILSGLNPDLLPSMMVIAFLHRVLVRPGECYKGFFHRDLPDRKHHIGTVVFYPSVRHSNIDGAELFAYFSSEGLALLRADNPDVIYTPRQYYGGAMVMPYPYNFAHGVRPGSNPNTGKTGGLPKLNDFLAPCPESFVKDLAIITISSISPVEQ